MPSKFIDKVKKIFLILDVSHEKRDQEHKISSVTFSFEMASIFQEYALSTKRCMLGNQDRYLARVVFFLLCSPILSPLEVISRKVFDEFTHLNKVRNFCHIFSTLLGTCS